MQWTWKPKEQRKQEKIEAECKWHKVFLFMPISISTGKFAWLEFMYRRLSNIRLGGSYSKNRRFEWEYKKDLLEILKDE